MLRHTYASNLLQRNITSQQVKELLGHQDIRTTMNVYSHYDQKELLEKVKVLDELQCEVKIPIFTSQLEKAREATDLANIRAMYAECTTSALTGTASDNNVTVTPDGGVVKAEGRVTMTQQTAGFADGSTSVKIGDITINNDDFKTGTATVTVTSDGKTNTIVIE